MLYGPNSQLDPDNFIQSVLQTIGEHKDLSKEFRRFLPDDIEEDEESMDRKYWQFRQNIMSAAGEEEIPDNEQSHQVDGLAGEI
jgi:hypothetical protein